ncbi:MAG: hypothetical protein AAF387_14315, partial [Pseudomonadota bacterium]
KTFVGPLKVNVVGVADVPTISATDVSGDTNNLIPLDFEGQLVDADTSESLYYIIEGVPQRSLITNAINNGDGSWTIPSAESSNIAIRPPHDFDGNIDLTVRAVTVENDGDIAFNTASFTVTVDDTGGGGGGGSGSGGDIPDAEGFEDQSIGLDLSALANYEDISVTVSGLPAEARLTAGEEMSNGDWSLNAEDIPNLGIIPALHDDSDFVLSISYSGKDVAPKFESVNVTVFPIADAPQVFVNSTAGTEDTATPLDLGGLLIDLDTSESLSYVIDELPEGAILSAGLANPTTGRWTLTEDMLDGLTVIPPQDFSGDLSFNFSAVATEHDGHYAVTASPVTVPIEAVADAPSIAASPEPGVEDEPLRLNLSVGETDIDGSETLSSVVLSKIPAGATLHGAIDNGDGTYTVALDQLNQLEITPPLHQHGKFSLLASIDSSEANGDTATTETTISFNVAPVPDVPTLALTDSVGAEDSAIALSIDSALVDTDGSEVLSIVLDGLPEGSVLSAGMNNGDGSWTLRPADLTNLNLTPPENYSGSLNLNVTAISLDLQTFASASTEQSFTVEVVGVADQPTLDVTDTDGLEDSEIPVVLNAELVDTDGSESISLIFTDFPAGSIFNQGAATNDGGWRIDSADTDNLTVTPPQNFAEAFDLSVAAFSVENNGDISEPVTATLNITPIAVADQAQISANSVSGDEDQVISLDLSAALVDTDGSEQMTVYISGLPSGASLSHGENLDGSTWQVNAADLPALQLTPPANYSGDLELKITVLTAEQSNQSAAMAEQSFTVSIDPSADAPVLSITPASGFEDSAGINLNIASVLTDLDGSESLSIQISDIPNGVTLNQGIDLGNGSWQLSENDLDNLQLIPPADLSGQLPITVTATATETNGDTKSVSEALNVNIAAVADSPELDVDPILLGTDGFGRLQIDTRLVDQDGSESLAIAISEVPEGVSLYALPIEAVDVSSSPLSVGIDSEIFFDLDIDDGSSGDVYGIYTIEKDTGRISDVKLINANNGDELAATSNLSAGSSIGVFTIRDGAVLNDFQAFQGGDIAFKAMNGAAASENSVTPKLWFLQEDGSETVVSGDIVHFGEQPNLNNANTIFGSGDLDVSNGQALLSLGDESSPVALSINLGVGNAIELNNQLSNESRIEPLEANEQGEYVLSPEQLAGLTINSTDNAAADLDFSVTAIAREASGETAEMSDDVQIHLRGQVDEVFNFNGTDRAFESSDTLHLIGVENGPGAENAEWALVVNEETAVEQQESALEFAEAVSGSIALEDGSTIDFSEITRIEW